MAFLTLENTYIYRTIGKTRMEGGVGGVVGSSGKQTLIKNVDRLPLKVVIGSLEVTPNVNINVTDLNFANNIQYKHFLNNSDYGITFKVDVIIGKNEMWRSESWGLFLMMRTKKYQDTLKKQGAIVDNHRSKFRVVNVLKTWIKNMHPLKVVTKAIDVPNGLYIITGNSTRKQVYENYTVWSLEFTTFNPLNLAVYKNNNLAIKKALAKKSTASNKAKFKKCKLSSLKYSKKKKTVDCVKYMQKILFKKGCLKSKSQIDGWYGKATCKAVRKFQDMYKKKYKLKVTSGKSVDKATFKAMCKV